MGIPYNYAIDMWSFGCILFELFVGYPLFAGENEKEHMSMIMEVKGVPPRSVLAVSYFLLFLRERPGGKSSLMMIISLSWFLIAEAR